MSLISSSYPHNMIYPDICIIEEASVSGLGQLQRSSSSSCCCCCCSPSSSSCSCSNPPSVFPPSIPPLSILANFIVSPCSTNLKPFLKFWSGTNFHGGDFFYCNAHLSPFPVCFCSFENKPTLVQTWCSKCLSNSWGNSDLIQLASFLRLKLSKNLPRTSKMLVPIILIHSQVGANNTDPLSSWCQ